MRRVYRPDLAPSWRFALWMPAGGFLATFVVSLLQRLSLGRSLAGASAFALGIAVVVALIIGIARRSRLIVEGREVIHQQVGRSQHAHDVGPGWRLISYARQDSGGARRFVRVLFDPEDQPRVMLNSSMWSIGVVAAALMPLGVAFRGEHDGVRPSAIDSMTNEQIGALSDDGAARLMKETEDASVPPMPKRVAVR